MSEQRTDVDALRHAADGEPVWQHTKDLMHQAADELESLREQLRETEAEGSIDAQRADELLARNDEMRKAGDALANYLWGILVDEFLIDQVRHLLDTWEKAKRGETK